MTERFNKTLADMLSMYVDVEQKNWDEILPFVTFAYNTAKQETTDSSQSRRITTASLSAHSESSRQRSSTLRFQTPNGILRSRRSRMGLYSSEKSRSLRKTLLRRYFGPYQVLRRLSAVTYEVQDFDPASRKRKLREVVHVLRMKPYHDPAEQIETEDILPKNHTKDPSLVPE
ncbi:transposon Ty3-I Gag-Pol polyprotein [Trichonephila clavipes]|nr:transposon Ty3-I Gag-Pol polyprotein [Trichonephila clavipes]